MRAPDPRTGTTVELLRLIGDTPGRPRRWFGRAAGRLVQVQVWDAGEPAPPANPRRALAEAKMVMVSLVTAAGGPSPRKGLLIAAAKANVAPSTAAKALAELVKDGELVNPRDRDGYRLPGWQPPPPPPPPPPPRQPGRPGLFDELEEE